MFDFLYNPSGRISRKGILLGFWLPYIALTSLLPALLVALGQPSLIIITELIGWFYLWPNLVAVPFKRFHDLGRSGWAYLAPALIAMLLGLTGITLAIGPHAEEMMGMLQNGAQDEAVAAILGHIRSRASAMALLAAATIINLALLLYMVGWRGQAGPNRFGEDPLATGRGFAD